MSSRTALRNFLYGINLNEGPLYFASNVSKEKLNLVAIANNDRIPGLQVSDSTLYNIWSFPPKDDIVKARINDRRLESSLRARWNKSGSIWSSFMLTKTSTENSYRSSYVVRFKNENKENTQQHTRDIIDFAKSFGIPSIWKLVPNATKMGYTVHVISCKSLNCTGIDRFEVLQVKYPSYHPSLDYTPSIFKSFDETRYVFELADSHLTLPEIKKLQHLAEAYSNKTFPTEGAYPNPFIVIEGLDGVGKFKFIINISILITILNINHALESSVIFQSGLHKIFNFLGPQCLSKYFLQVMRFLAKVTFLSIISDFLDHLFSSASSFYKVYLTIGDMLD